MKKIFTKVKQGNILSERIKHFLTAIEFSLFILVIDMILPINNEFNYYFPFYFLNPILYFELAKTTNYTVTKNDQNYINDTLKLVRESNNILFHIADKYIYKLSIAQKSFCYYNTTLLYCSLALFFVILGGFFFLIYLNDKDTKSSEIKNNYNLYINILIIVLNYIFLKPFVFVFFIIYSNYLIPVLFFLKNGTFDFLIIIELFCLMGVILFAIIFIEYLWIAFSIKIGDQYTFNNYEKIKLLNKLLICFLIQFDHFDSFHYDFLKIIILITFTYQIYIYYKSFIDGLVNNIMDYLFINFILAFMIVRFINLIGNTVHKGTNFQSRSYHILLLILNFLLFFIFIIKLKEIINTKKENSLLQETAKIPLHLAQIMGNYIENIFSISNLNVFMKLSDINTLVKILKTHKTNCLNINNFNCNFCKKFDFKKGNYDNKIILKTILKF